MRSIPTAAGASAPAFASALLFAGSAGAVEPVSTFFYGFQAEQAEYRYNNSGDEQFSWDIDARAGTDELLLRYTGEGDYLLEGDNFEAFENRLFIQVPVSMFFNMKAGARYDVPNGPNRFFGVVGVEGLASQWIEADLDLFVSEDGDPSIRLDSEYEALITNRLILTPSIEFTLPLTDAERFGEAAFGPFMEVGARISYDVYDRVLSPYVGVHYERSFGGTADLALAEGDGTKSLSVVAGFKMLF